VGAGEGVGGGRALGAGDRAAAGDQPADGGADVGERGAAALSARTGGLAAGKVRAGLAAAGRGVAADQGAAGDGGVARVRLAGSVDAVRRRLRELRPRVVRPAQRTGYRPGQVLQLDWAEMPTRPRVAGRERRLYALVASLPYSGAQTAFFSFEMTIESFLEGHARAFEWLEGVPRECVYDNLRSVVARRERDEVVWNPRFLHLRGHYAFHATACTPATPREKGSVEAAVRYLKTGFWPARRFASLGELDGQYADWRDEVCNRRRHASGRFLVERSLEEERAALRPLPPERFDWSAARIVRVPADGYLRHGGCFYRAPASLVQQRVELRSSRDEVWIRAHGITVAIYRRCYQPGTWLPAPVMRPEPPPPSAPAKLTSGVTPPELADYAELCA
jgi:transposase